MRSSLNILGFIPGKNFYQLCVILSLALYLGMEVAVYAVSCSVEAPSFNHYSVCELLYNPTPTPPPPPTPTVTPVTKRRKWDFNDCWYCRGPSNPCFTTPCTFAMYVVAECGTRMSIPLFDVETADISIKDCSRDMYVTLYAESEYGWTAGPATNISWMDCSGTRPEWNSVTTTIWFYGSPNLCGVYRVEFKDWGGNIWSLIANCKGDDDPVFYIYDNYPEAAASYREMADLSISDVTVKGTCPDFQVSFFVTNTGCIKVNAPVCVKSDLPGGPWHDIIHDIYPGDTKGITMDIKVTACPMGDHQIIASVDCDNVVPECSEFYGRSAFCPIPGGRAISINFPIYIL